MKLEYVNHTKIHEALQTFIFHPIQNPKSHTDRRAQCHMLFAHINMEDFGEMYVEVDGSQILITLALLIEYGILADIFH